jgi:hypothetical protein
MFIGGRKQAQPHARDHLGFDVHVCAELRTRLGATLVNMRVYKFAFPCLNGSRYFLACKLLEQVFNDDYFKTVVVKK